MPHLALPQPKTEKSRQAAAAISGVLLAVTVVLAIIGYTEPSTVAGDCHDTSARAIDRFYRAFLLFDFGGEGLKLPQCYPDNIVLEVARLTGPAGLLAGVAALLWGLVEDLFAGIRLRVTRGHAVVVGLGARGRALAGGAAKSMRVVGVDLDAMTGALPNRCASVLGDAREARTLKRAQTRRAQVVYAATGDDMLNLQIARAARAMGCHDAYALVDDAFARRLADSAEPAPVNAVSVAEVAARTLGAEARFHELADLQGQGQVHLAVFGDGALAGAIIAQTVRTALTDRLERPIVSLLAADPEQARKSILRSYPGLERAARLDAVAFDPAVDILDQPALYGQIAAKAPVTAVVVVDDVVNRACLFAGALQAALRRAEAWPVPIFFSAAPAAAAAAFAAPLRSTPRLSDVLHPFEAGVSLCTPDNVARIDEDARALHASYLKAHRALGAGGEPPSMAQGALVDWEHLPSTFRQSNRRAADHVPAKLLSAGCYCPPGPLRLAADLDLTGDGRLERLAELEHRAWMADRLLSGWRPGAARNERARIHECLIPYAKLPNPTKELDRAQVRDLAAHGLSRGGPAVSADPGLVRLDLWVGLIGALDVKETEVEQLTQAVCAELDRLAAATPGRHLTFVTPLAPGADLILTRGALTHAAQRGWPHRLVVVEALEPSRMIADFEGRWQAGAAGDVKRTDLAWPDAAKALLAARREVVAAAPAARVAEIGQGPLAAADAKAAYRLQNAYLIRRCDVLLAAVRDKASRAAGGTAEALRWRSNPLSTPKGFARIAPRTKDAKVGRSTVLVELAAHKVL